MNIPWAVPNLSEEDKQAIYNVLDSNWYSMGPVVEKFENKLSKYLEIDHSVATNNGTSALDIALKCLEIKKGDEIVIPALTYISTGNVVLYNNGTPIFVDIDDTLNIDTSLIEDEITNKTKAIISIDFGGNVCDYNRLQKICRKHKIPQVVDGAQSFGSIYHGKKCCTHGFINTTSFHAAKILTTIEGGMLFTNNHEIFQKAKKIRNQGESSKYIHEYVGNNYRMTDLNASIGINQIDRLEKILESRWEKAKFYIENLQNVEFPKILPNTVHSYTFFSILTKDRDKLSRYLRNEGIDTRITFPIPIYEQRIFNKYFKKVCHKAEMISKKIISLPIYGNLTKDQQNYIVKKINKFTE